MWIVADCECMNISSEDPQKKPCSGKNQLE